MTLLALCVFAQVAVWVAHGEAQAEAELRAEAVDTPSSWKIEVAQASPRIDVSAGPHNLAHGERTP